MGEMAMGSSEDPILDDEAMAVLVDVLVYHYRKNSSDCGCGWAVLGASHPAHVAEVFRDSLTARQSTNGSGSQQ